MSKLLDAMRRKYRTPEAAVRALGLDSDLLKGEDNMTTSYTRDRGFSRSRRMGRDQEEEREELQEILNDPEASFADKQEALITLHSEDQEVDPTMRELGPDRRGPRQWARDRTELRAARRAADARRARDKRRLGKDFGPENLTDPDSLREMEAARTAEDRHLAFDHTSPRESFARMYLGAARYKGG